MDANLIRKIFHAQIAVNGHIIGACVGSGITAKYTVWGGTDFLLAVAAGKYRIMGRSSLASYLCYGNNNDIVMEMGTRELFPLIHKTPVIFGLFAQDPNLDLKTYLPAIQAAGFAGVTNFPTLSLIDGRFRTALEQEGTTFAQEVTALKQAHELGLFTVAFVTTIAEARAMLAAQADIICVHLGLTLGGYLGAKQSRSINEAKNTAATIFRFCKKENPQIITAIYSGMANTVIDMDYFYQNTQCDCYIGGSTFDRIPMEQAIVTTAKKFKNQRVKLPYPESKPDYVYFVQKYIEANYMRNIQLSDLALTLHISPAYLSSLFKQKVGTSFTSYLVEYRLNLAQKLLRKTDLSCKEISHRVGYHNYAQFSKIFKIKFGYSPRNYRNSIHNHIIP